METRVIKRYDRNIITGKVFSFYVVQYLGINILKSIFYFKKYLERKDFTELECYLGDCMECLKKFHTPKEAKEFMKNLQENIYADEIIS